ncbi:MAG: hypothetical protein ACRDTA_12715 [Pseudonocardiaceae bacterium]
MVVALDRLGRSLSGVIRTVETLTEAWCCNRLDLLKRHSPRRAVA